MECHTIKKCLPIYLDGELSSAEAARVKQHLDVCSDCLAEYELCKQTWDICDMVPKIEPRADFVSQFWTRLSNEQTPLEKLFAGLKNIFTFKKPAMAFVFSAVAIIIFMSAFNLYQLRGASGQRSLVVKNNDYQERQQTQWGKDIVAIELVEDIEIIDNLDFFEDMDMLEQFDV